MDPYLTQLDSVRTSRDGVTITSGKRGVASSDGTVDIFDVNIRPNLLYNRNFRPRKKGQKVFDAITEGNSDIWSSWNPYFAYMERKSSLERILAAYEAKSGIRVERPKTVIASAKFSDCEKWASDFFNFCQAGILKPSRGTHSKNIEIVGSEDIERIAQRLRAEPEEEFVLQELVDSSPLLDGHRFDLRLFAMVWDFQVPKFSLYREGVVRVAGRPYDPRALLDQDSYLTGIKYRRSRRLSTYATTVSATLPVLSQQGLDVSDFWDLAQALCSQLFTAIEDFASDRGIAIERNFFFTGFDLVVKRHGKRMTLVLLEINDLPQFLSWGTNVDEKIILVMKALAEDLRDLSRSNGKIPTGAAVRPVA